ncbi:TPA: tellurium resistance protein TerW [Salmonella enterica subsp. enterica serovar Heidelberg]|nr:tellurium resistance protein TerW [Salmonella enterica subsp. enterica]ECI5008161.1 tellurium resistance protein TerW [Salmonella enterica subsp. enterica]EDQ6915880.1 tellurium resistance protein TerW [Salmonella enterica subsp. enterica]EEE3036676.1 tellurium resistance protein TerW [Salmonella enterica subsp. enterica]HBI4356890.1 tellurium resistance protein TerW [Salmonella enterica subsp. enterica serovar Heidelberg]
MQLNTRQARIFKLSNLLGTGKPVSAADIITSLECSEPTLTRALKELRESYSAEIKYSKAGHSYHLVNPGQLDKKTLRWMNEALAQNAELKTGESTGKVVLDKDKKTAVSLSLRMRILRKIDRLAALSGSTRSEAVEKLALHSVDELIKEYSAKKS